MNEIRLITRGCYDIQKIRIEAGNRLVTNFKVKLGIKPGEKETENKEAEKVLKLLKIRYDKVTEGVESFSKKRKFKYDGVISTFTELCFVRQWVELMKREKEQFKLLEQQLEDEPLWTQFLYNVKGCGPAMAGVIISEFNIHDYEEDGETKRRYVSSLWKYAGLDVVLQDGKPGEGRSRKKEHLVEKEYVDKNGEIQTKMGITFNPHLKTKLIGVLGPSFMRSKSPYSDIYRAYRHRLETDPEHAKKTKLHIHNMSIRYMVKMFIKDLYVAWREIEGLPVYEDYHEAKHGHKHNS